MVELLRGGMILRIQHWVDFMVLLMDRCSMPLLIDSKSNSAETCGWELLLSDGFN